MRLYSNAEFGSESKETFSLQEVNMSGSHFDYWEMLVKQHQQDLQEEIKNSRDVNPPNHVLRVTITVFTITTFAAILLLAWAG